MDSLAFDTVLGLVFVFAVVSLAVTSLTEAGARFVGLRGEYLLRGMRSLLDGGGTFELPWRDLVPRRSNDRVPEETSPEKAMVAKVMEQTVIATSARSGVPDGAGDTPLTNAQRRRVPSYVSARSFSRALIDALVPDATGSTTLAKAAEAVEAMAPGNPLRTPLLRILEESAGDIAAFRQGVEGWYDDHMARVSGWYKRHTRWISLGIAALLVVLFNVNTIEIGRALYADQALRDSVVSQAVEASDCGDLAPAACLGQVREKIDELRGSGLPVGWGTSAQCVEGGCSWAERLGLVERDAGFGRGAWTFLLVLLGWVVMAAATLPGSRFWFDSLARLGSLRSTGPKPRASS